MAQHQITESELVALASGQHRVVSTLIDEGRLPEHWVAQYCDFLAGAIHNIGGGAFWPWKLFQAVHFVSFHLWFRYAAWRSFENKANRETELLLGRVQLASELFLWNSACSVPLLPDPGTSSGEGE